jgi:sugar O-acyltransferase (sialic acid O-acetyltransferase NeuD family)
MKQRIAFIGAGILGKQAIQIHETNPIYEIVGFYDDTLNRHSEVHGFTVLGKLTDVYPDYINGLFDALCITIGYKHLAFKTQLFHKFSSIPLANIIHRTAIIENTAKLNGSNIIYAKAYIGHECVLHPGVIINIDTYLAHNVVIGSSAFLSGGIQIAGHVNIGEETFIGIGVVCIDDIKIEKENFIGAGTVVINDLIKGKYIGNPARNINK